MEGIPVLAFAAYSGTGKTTLLEKVIRALKDRGVRIAVIKHDGHDFEIDREGKDSWRFTQAGADISIISSAAKTALVKQRPSSFAQAAAMVHDADLILVEGYKNEPLTQIGICRQASGKGFTSDISRYAAVVTDADIGDADIPRFGFDDIEELTEFIVKNMDGFIRFHEQEWAKAADMGEASPARRAQQEHPPRQKAPSMDMWMQEAKAAPAASRIGMYLTHSGIVRETAKAAVRNGDETSGPVRGMLFSYDAEKVSAAIRDTYQLDGIYYVKAWLNEGVLQVGDDIMQVLVGGDIRPHVIDALQYLVGRLKEECVTETELY